MNNWVNVHDMPLVQKLLRNTASRIKYLTGKEVTLMIKESIYSPVTKQEMIKQKVKDLVCFEIGRAHV